MAKDSVVVSDQGANELRQELPAKSVLGRAVLFVFGALPSDEWRPPVVVWILFSLSAVLMVVSYSIRHWGLRLGGLDASAFAAGASTGGTVLLAVTIFGSALARARKLMASSDKNVA